MAENNNISLYLEGTIKKPMQLEQNKKVAKLYLMWSEKYQWVRPCRAYYIKKHKQKQKPNYSLIIKKINKTWDIYRLQSHK